MSATRFLVVQTGTIRAKVKDACTLGAFLLLLAGSLCAQQPEVTVSVDAQKLQELLTRIADLEQSQKQLLQRVAQLETLSGVHSPAVTSASGPVASSSSSPSLVLAGGSPKPEPTKPAPGNGQQSEQSPTMGETDHMDVSRTALIFEDLAILVSTAAIKKDRPVPSASGKPTSLSRPIFQNGLDS